MPDMRKIIAVTFGDIHLSPKAPIARSAEKDWLEVTARYLQKVRSLSIKYQAPIVCTGDIFDDGWRTNKCPPEIINFALEHLPNEMFCIPGQHDLPHHRYDQIKKSAYWTLVRANKINDLSPGIPIAASQELILYGIPWGFDIIPDRIHEKLLGCNKTAIHLAVIHKYIWKDGHSFPGAPVDAHISEVKKNLLTFDAAVFGDNHKGFFEGKIFNGGSFMRRKSDERDYLPMIGLLCQDGSWQVHHFNCDEDKWISPQALSTLKTSGIGEDEYKSLVEMYETLSVSSIDFVEAVKDYLTAKKCSPGVRKLILEAMEESC